MDRTWQRFRPWSRRQFMTVLVVWFCWAKQDILATTYLISVLTGCVPSFIVVGLVPAEFEWVYGSCLDQLHSNRVKSMTIAITYNVM